MFTLSVISYGSSENIWGEGNNFIKTFIHDPRNYKKNLRKNLSSVAGDVSNPLLGVVSVRDCIRWSFHF